ncbi:MAG: hypothetical protein OEW26_04520 [Nitrospirota bacterium]|nr:hypothetical protein [Nitrospirota bacterium]
MTPDQTALSWPFGCPVRFADPFGLAQDKSGGGANSLSSNSAPSSFRTRLLGSATPKAEEKKGQNKSQILLV